MESLKGAELRKYREWRHWRKVAALFNKVFAGRFGLVYHAVNAGFVRDRLRARMSDALASDAWVCLRDGAIDGFISAHMSRSDEGLITTPVAHDMKTARVLLDEAEGFLRDQRARNVRVEGVHRLFNVGFGEPLHMWLLRRGYNSYKYRTEPWYGLELAVELDLSQFTITPTVENFRRKNEADGLVFEFLRAKYAASLRELASESPAEWAVERISEGAPYVICRDGETVIGFCGACGVMYGIGGSGFIFLKGEYHHRGIGAVMLSMALEWIKVNGGRCSVLFTGVDNRAQRLYRSAGYRFCFISAHNVEKALVGKEDNPSP